MRREWRCLVAGAILLALALPACGQTQDGVGPISNAELSARIAAGDAPLVLDVRTVDEYRGGHIPGAVHIPHDELAGRLSDLDTAPSEEIVVHCESGRRAQAAGDVLVEAGFTRVRDLEGHMKGWRAAELPTEGAEEPKGGH